MKEHDATEIAYNNGYADGKRDACKWIPFKRRLPEKDGDYLVITERGTITDLPFSTQYKAFNADSCCGTKYAIPVTHWMPLPEEPDVDDKPMTNADRIRAMSDEELAELFVHYYALGAEVASGTKISPEVKQEMSKIMLKNLQQPAEGE